MRTIASLVAGSTLLVLVACKDLAVPDLNNTSLDDLLNHPTAAKIANATQGLLTGTRENVAFYVRDLGIFGREGFDLEPTEPRTVTQLMEGPLDPGSFGGGQWTAAYADIRNVNILMHALDKDVDMIDPDKEAVRGFAQTIQALDFFEIIATRDSFGAPIAVDIDALGPPAPIATRAQVYQHILNLLDSAVIHLQAADAAFPFRLSAGFSSFATPLAFVQLNRALKARTEVYLDDWANALAAINGSFLDTTRALSFGAYHSYSTGPGDEPNPNFDPVHLFANPELITQAQLQTDGVTLDQRVLDKITPTTAPPPIDGVTSNQQFTLYDAPDKPIPLIRNEELILLRAEIALGQGDLATAARFINFTRVSAGKLPAIATLAAQTPDSVLTILLYEKRYSLVWEGGFSWLDLRHYSRLPTLSRIATNGHFYLRMPFPTNECTPRNPEPPGCAFVNGF
ncbi:MAG TPA: RagB/SusD family nutrient uptake outer membrane protein [Gemmatimonadales bacterium]|nr:RagB/SusD family nutrient uptake outer membrane protein [Gemmatimonadales bacterium]